MTDRKVIAIDGPAGSGKSTVARRLARRIGFRYLDSGAMYRAVALRALRENVPEDDPDRLRALLVGSTIELTEEAVFLNEEDVSEEIRSAAVTGYVSKVAAVSEVRQAMVAKQRAAWPGEPLVVEGRDIGSVVFPDADLKIYLTASPGERARRRAAETGRDEGEVLAEITARDAFDSNREHSPLTRTPDAVEVDTTGLDVEEVVAVLARLVQERLGA